MATNCKGCGKLMIWGQTEDGKKIPLDPRPAIYRMPEQLGIPNETPLVEKTRHGVFMVSHFATCPKAAQFSASRKKKAAAPSDTPA